MTEARDVSNLSKVPQSKIYHILDQLHEKGLVVVLPEFPKKYAPVPFTEYLTRLHDEHERAAQAIERDLDDLAQMFSLKGGAEAGDRGDFAAIRGRRNTLEKVMELLANAEEDFTVLATPGFAERFEHFRPAFERARARGVRLRFVVPVNAETMDKLRPLAALADVRHRSMAHGVGANVAIYTADAKRGLLVAFVPDDGNLYTGKDVGMYTDQDAIVATLRGLIETCWSGSKTFSSMTPTSIRVEGPPSSPDALKTPRT